MKSSLKKIVTLLLTAVLVMGIIPKACAETVNDYLDDFKMATKELNANITDDLKITVRTTSSGSYSVNLPQLSGTEAIMQFFKDEEQVPYCEAVEAAGPQAGRAGAGGAGAAADVRAGGGSPGPRRMGDVFPDLQRGHDQRGRKRRQHDDGRGHEPGKGPDPPDDGHMGHLRSVRRL